MSGQPLNDKSPNTSSPNSNSPNAHSPNTGISRRDILRTLAVSAVGGSVLQVIPADAAEYVHELVRGEKNAAPVAGKYVPKYFSAHQYATVTFLCNAIIPKDEKSGGAVEAGAPEFIDLLTSENEQYQLALGGGLFWLDGLCADRYNSAFLECTPQQKTEVLDLIAYRKNAKQDASLSQGVAFFSFIRNLTCDAFYTSKIGIADLQYIGNVPRSEFPGCPPLPSET
ncbi:MAG TPA: gluconate 2-dehydrogenase subunit 3 family protein [Candidatus Dormibacteraeota bacterium]|nr:gluconate 2-dehydrogenase subunit 3 family protein [Candidatus Dormibacteraeota bacterium]